MKNQTNWASPKSLGNKLLLLTMKGYLLFFCTLAMGMNTDKVLSQQMVVIATDQVLTVDEVFDLIMEQTDYNFIYQVDLFKGKPKVELKKGKIKVDKLLQLSLADSPVILDLTDSNTIFIKPESMSMDQRQQDFVVTGKVTNLDGVPLPGVTVRIKNMNRGVATDFNGDFKIMVPDESSVLVFTSVGYRSQEISVGKLRTVNISLEESVSELDEVVLNAGYYKTSQRKATGNIARIDKKTIENQPVNNPLGALQGYVSGVDIRQTTGVPGGGFEIEIRGRNFINGGTNPLFIVDGVPFSSESLEATRVGSQINQANVSPLNALNPQDIESIEILKEADATAIYGSRGANGVVLITTRKGKAGKTQFTANLSTSLGKVSQFRNLMTTDQFLEVRREGAVQDGYGSFLEDPAFDFFWPDITVWGQDRYTDWQKELIGGTAFRNNVQLSISGGSDQTQFLISGAHQKQTTVFPGDSNYKKTTVHSNVNHQSKDGRFSLNFSTNYAIENNDLLRQDPTSLAYSLPPNAPAVYDEEGNINWENNTFRDNPMAQMLRDYQVQTKTLIANLGVSYRLLSSLEFKTNLGYNNSEYGSFNTFPHDSRSPGDGYTSRTGSIIDLNTSARDSWIVEPQINWMQEWNGLKLDVLVGSTFQQETTEQFVQRGRGFASNQLIQNIAAAETVEIVDDIDSEYNYQAFFGRLNLNWKDRYIVNLTGRRDGSSRFGPGKQFGNFGAVGAAWIFSNENFLKDNPTFNFGKIRASYGTTGSDNIGNYKFLDTYTTSNEQYNGINIMEPSGIFNPILAWEENKKLEFGLELGFFKDRLVLNTSWYRNRSSNQLIGIPLAATTGFGSLEGNFDAVVQNTGFELDLNTVNVQGKGFRWTTSFNITVPKNELLKFDDIENSTFANRYEVGKSLNIRYLFRSLGVNPETGLYEFEDFNNDGLTDRTNDRQVTRDFTPDLYGGLGNTLRYKNLSLDFFFQFKKQLGYNYYRDQNLPGYPRNLPVDFYDRWQEPGDIAPYPRATAGLDFSGDLPYVGGYQATSDAAVTDASFIRLRNVLLTYRIPKGFSLGLDASVYLQGQNLLTITGYRFGDPEQTSFNYLPPLRQFTLGLNLNF